MNTRMLISHLLRMGYDMDYIEWVCMNNESLIKAAGLKKI